MKVRTVKQSICILYVYNMQINKVFVSVEAFLNWWAVMIFGNRYLRLYQILRSLLWLSETVTGIQCALDVSGCVFMSAVIIFLVRCLSSKISTHWDGQRWKRLNAFQTEWLRCVRSWQQDAEVTLRWGRRVWVPALLHTCYCWGEAGPPENRQTRS